MATIDLKPLLETQMHFIKNSTEFIDAIKHIRMSNGDIMVRFNVVSYCGN